MAVTAEEMFGGLGKVPGKTLAKRHKAYMDQVNGIQDVPLSKAEWASQAPHATGLQVDLESRSAAGRPRTAMDMLTKTLQSPELVKAMSAESLASLVATLDAQKAQVPELMKDITTTSPVGTGLVVFDLETGAKMLTPKPTPLRNRLVRRRGFGLAHRFKRITGFTGTGTGGVSVIRPGIADSTQTNFANPGSAGTLLYNRGGKISYAGDEFTIPYIQFGVSDELSWSTQFSAQGFQDVRALSRNAVTWSSMLLEERVLLYGRGTASGFAGVLPVPTGVAGTSRAATGSEVGISGATTSLWVRVVAELGDYGVSQATAVSAAIAVTNGQVTDITYVLPAGATGARVFVGTGAADPGDAARWLYVFAGSPTTPTPGGRSGFNKLTIQGALPVAGIIPTAYPSTVPGAAPINLTTTDGGSAYVNEYDGVLTYCTGANAGYTAKLNSTFSTTNPGVEYQQAFSSLYDAVKASPDRIMFNGNDRRQMSDTIKGNPNSNYGIRLMQDDINGVTLGSVAVSIINETVGDKEVQFEVHPWLPQGNSLILSDTLPIPDTQVDQIFAVFNVQDLMGIDWPVTQFSYDTSSYWFGTLVCYAPAWLGSVVGIQRT
jgi:hypothetical protein